MIDFAFFVANFGYTRSDYDNLTLTERAFIFKAWEDKQVVESTLIDKAVFNATVNANRKKGKKIHPLWEKKKTARQITEIEATKFKDAKEKIQAIDPDGNWIKRIYSGR